jgi:hypothetical protein
MGHGKPVAFSNCPIGSILALSPPMKKITRFSFALIAIALAVPAVHAGENGLPPGLQKKDKLPPGWEKKMKHQGEETATAAGTNAVVVPATPAVPAAPSVSTPAVPAPAVGSVPAKVPAPAPAPERTARAVKADIDQRVQVLNTLDNKTAARKAGVATIMKETGLTTRAIENVRKEFPEVGTGGLLIASEIASQTKKPVINFVRQHKDGKPWTKIAAEHNVKLDTIDAKLARVEASMRAAK